MSIESGWKNYERDAIPAAASENQRAQLRMAFHFGAIAVIRQVSEGTHPDSKDFKEKVARRMGVLAAEGIMFAQSVAEKIEQAVKVEQAGKN